MNLFLSAIVGLGLTVVLGQPVVAPPATIKVFTTRAIATVLDKAGAEFEQTTGHKLDVTRDIAIRMVRRIQTGETFDLLVASPDQIDLLIKESKIIAETRTNLARSGIGVEVRSGVPKPDISTVEAFKRTLLSAKSIAYLKEGQSGIYLDSLIKRLGLTEAIKLKVVRPDTDIVSELVAKGEVELGLVVITQIMTTKGVELVGPLPAEVQSYIVFAAGVSSNSKARTAAKELVSNPIPEGRGFALRQMSRTFAKLDLTAPAYGDASTNGVPTVDIQTLQILRMLSIRAINLISEPQRAKPFALPAECLCSGGILAQPRLLPTDKSGGIRRLVAGEN